ncbi:MAG: hypothetical protein HY445_00440 [Candidatus Niyogibacteria bacterium]|nr:hypothetical protein [Candidatus Niyogibacteria bacterium]
MQNVIKREKSGRNSPIIIQSNEENVLLELLQKRHDTEGERLKRFLAMPDLTRVSESPLKELVARIVALPRFSDFDILKVPEIVSAEVSFDLFNFPADHPARNRSDTYYVDDKHILRTHTTIMWYFYLNEPAIKARITNKESVGSLSYGKVYRKDEIDRNHMNVFHQMDGWYLLPKNKGVISVDDLKEVLIEIAQAIFGKEIEYRFNKDTFPYTNPSIEMEIQREGRWIEVLGSGVVHPMVLQHLSVNPDEYTGWAFGFGLERLAILAMNLPDIRLLWSTDARVKKQLRLGRAYVPVSKYPKIERDISFVVGRDFVPNNYFDLIRDIGGDLIEEVALLDTYEDAEKFGKDKVSYTYRIIYRSGDRTLRSEEVDRLQNMLYQETAEQCHAELR